MFTNTVIFILYWLGESTLTSALELLVLCIWFSSSYISTPYTQDNIRRTYMGCPETTRNKICGLHSSRFKLLYWMEKVSIPEQGIYHSYAQLIWPRKYAINPEFSRTFTNIKPIINSRSLDALSPNQLKWEFFISRRNIQIPPIEYPRNPPRSKIIDSMDL